MNPAGQWMSKTLRDWRDRHASVTHKCVICDADFHPLNANQTKTCGREPCKAEYRKLASRERRARKC